jgi:hypothetical protein
MELSAVKRASTVLRGLVPKVSLGSLYGVGVPNKYSFLFMLIKSWRYIIQKIRVVSLEVMDPDAALS